MTSDCIKKNCTRDSIRMSGAVLLYYFLLSFEKSLLKVFHTFMTELLFLSKISADRVKDKYCLRFSLLRWFNMFLSVTSNKSSPFMK